MKLGANLVTLVIRRRTIFYPSADNDEVPALGQEGKLKRKDSNEGRDGKELARLNSERPLISYVLTRVTRVWFQKKI